MSKIVAVWHSDPRYGDPYEGVFYMRPPYTREQLERQAEQKGRTWAKRMAGGGLVMTAAPKLAGPLGFRHVDRHDLGETRREDDEYVFVAWYRRDKPLLLTTDEIERRRSLAARYGITPEAPVRDGNPTPGVRPVMASEMGDYIDPSGRDESGLTAVEREVLGIVERAS